MQPTDVLRARPLRAAKSAAGNVAKRLEHPARTGAENHRQAHRNAARVRRRRLEERPLPAVHHIDGKLPLVPRAAFRHRIDFAGGLVHVAVERVAVNRRGAGVEPHPRRRGTLRDRHANHLGGKLTRLVNLPPVFFAVPAVDRAPGEVDDRLRTVEFIGPRVEVGTVPPNEANALPVLMMLPGEHHHLPALGREVPGDMPADEAAATRDHDLLFARRQAWQASHDSG